MQVDKVIKINFVFASLSRWQSNSDETLEDVPFLCVMWQNQYEF